MPQKDDSVLAHYGLGGSGDEQPGGGLTDWAVPWSDLMMTLCVLFVVLFVYASTHKNVTVLFRPNPSQAVDPVGGMSERLLDRLEDRTLFLRVTDGREVLYRSDHLGVSVVREPGGHIRVTLRGDVFFEPGHAELQPRSLAYLDEVAGILRTHGGLIHVLGYVDESEASTADGFDLSARRAANVARHLLDTQGLDPRRLLVSGHGAYRPESPSGLPGGPERNRRVEILLLADR